MAYCTVDDLVLRYGAKNLAKWAGIDGDTSRVAEREAAAIDYATAEINKLLTRGGYAVPLVFIDVYAQATVQDWCIALAAYKLYIARGHLDEDKSEGKLDGEREKVMNEIARVRAGAIQLNCQRRWGDNPTVPTVMGG